MHPIPPALVAALGSAQSVVVLTGSGVSAESGVPTFRDAQTGLWERFRPEELATPEAYARNPKLVWDWYTWRRDLVRQAEPNPGHAALAELEKLVAEFTLVTQNVDGLHQRAGNRNVIEFHGNIMRDRCFNDETVIAGWAGKGELPPPCPDGTGHLRPDVVWFGEMIPQAALARSFEAAERCQVFFSIGTSAVVQPAAGLAEVAVRAGATLVEINTNPTPLTSLAEHFLQGPSGEILPGIVRALKARAGSNNDRRTSP